jgi:hypothetical protein
MLRFSLFLILLLPVIGLAETLNVDVSDSCRNELEKKIHGLNCDEVTPLEMKHLDENNQTWIIRFHFGFSRTNYHPTDMDIKSDLVTMKIDDVKMYERTSAHYYNPKNWDHAGEAFKWIDEPTNTMALSLEKGKNNFYVTVFHPKYLKSIIYNDSGSEVEYFEGVEDNRLNQPRPPGFKMLYLQNTHKNMVWQIGYGRQLKSSLIFLKLISVSVLGPPDQSIFKRKFLDPGMTWWIPLKGIKFRDIMHLLDTDWSTKKARSQFLWITKPSTIICTMIFTTGQRTTT